jgi:hypothetical protein
LPSFVLSTHGESSVLFDKSIQWAIQKKAIILEEKKSSFIKASNYHSYFGEIKSPMSIRMEEKGDNIDITISFGDSHLLWIFIGKYKDFHHWVLVEDYFNFLDIQLEINELRRLYPYGLLVESIVASLFFSIGLLILSLAGVLGFFDFYPHPSVILFLGCFIIMVWASYPFIRTLIKSTSLFFELY